jgi:hypothetical protein
MLADGERAILQRCPADPNPSGHRVHACRVPTGTLPACGVQRIDSISQMENNHGITPNRLVLGG